MSLRDATEVENQQLELELGLRLGFCLDDAEIGHQLTLTLTLSLTITLTLTLTLILTLTICISLKALERAHRWTSTHMPQDVVEVRARTSMLL